jgi:hypothetical protein
METSCRAIRSWLSDDKSLATTHAVISSERILSKRDDANNGSVTSNVDLLKPALPTRQQDVFPSDAFGVEFILLLLQEVS